VCNSRTPTRPLNSHSFASRLCLFVQRARFEELSKKDASEYNVAMARYLSDKNLEQEEKERKLLLDTIEGYSSFFASMVDQLDQLKSAVNSSALSSRAPSISEPVCCLLASYPCDQLASLHSC
jgi:hypothetical protein